MPGRNRDDDETQSGAPLESSSDNSPTVASDAYFGIILKDRYLIERELGRGGIGVIYLAQDKQLLSRRVVIKVLLEETLAADVQEWFKKKFQQEVEALARIDHPCVVGVLDAGTMPDGKPYLVMQYIEGKNLRSLLQSSGMNLEWVARIIRQIGHALNAAHDKEVYHRDLKPENIMLQILAGGEELVKLIDFGIARVKHSQIATSTEISKIVGTIAYMAPEQLLGDSTPTSDIYALGVIAYEMTTGRRPFNPESPYQLLELQRAGVKVLPIDLRPDLPLRAQAAILKALAFEPEYRFTNARDFGEELSHALLQKEKSARITSVTDPASLAGYAEDALTTPASDMHPAAVMRVALLYKRNAQPDEQVLQFLESQLLASGYTVFIDRHLTIGVEWAREIERQVRSADAVIPLLSAASVTSEMLTYEIQIAHEAAQRQNGRPRLLPVRINYDGLLPDPLAGILNPIQYAMWGSSQDNPRLIEEVVTSLQTPTASLPVPTPRKLEAIGGAVPLDSEYYVVRPTDEEFRTAIARQDSIVLVKGARQMGKTSLLARGLQQAREAGANVVLTDFQILNAAHLASVETFFMTLAELIADQLDLDISPKELWSSSRGPSMNFGRFMRREVLGKLNTTLVWGLDEVDRLFACDFGSEVFGLFRSWHNARSLDPTGPWQRLTLAIAYATEAHLFITDINQSPFNVGTRLGLDDFTIEQVAELNRRYGSPLRDASEVARFFRLVSGHPYLVRRGLHELVLHPTGLAAFADHADRDEGPFGDHLRRILVLLAQDAELCDVVRGILQGRPCPTPESFYRLRSAGIITGDSQHDARLRCQLYTTYLERHLL